MTVGIINILQLVSYGLPTQNMMKGRINIRY